MLTVHDRLVDDLEERAGLDRELEALPSNAEFRRADKAEKGLTSPELATLMAHVKLALKDELLASDLPDAEVFAQQAAGVLPEPAAASGSARRSGRTRCVARSSSTMLVNEVVDGGGISYAFRLAEEMSADATGRGARLRGGQPGVRPVRRCGARSPHWTTWCRPTSPTT